MNPEEDGKTHINVYSQGKTELGRFLSNWAHTQIDTVDGRFQSIEGYWYWLGCSHQYKERLRLLYGYQAKKIGRELRATDWNDTPEFKQKICDAITIKLNSNPKMLALLKANTLLLTHYYVYNGKVVTPSSGEWIIDHIFELSKETK